MPTSDDSMWLLCGGSTDSLVPFRICSVLWRHSMLSAFNSFLSLSRLTRARPRKDGLHRSWCGRRTRTQPDRRKSPRWSASRPIEGQAARATQEIDRRGSDQIHASKWCFLASDRSNVGSFSRFDLCSSQGCPSQESGRKPEKERANDCCEGTMPLPEIAPKGFYFYLATTPSPTDKGRRHLYSILRPKQRFGEIRVTLSPERNLAKPFDRLALARVLRRFPK